MPPHSYADANIARHSVIKTDNNTFSPHPTENVMYSHSPSQRHPLRHEKNAKLEKTEIGVWKKR